MNTDERLRMGNPWDVFEVAMNDTALAEDLLRDRRTRTAFREELERTLRMFERDQAAPKVVLALR